MKFLTTLFLFLGLTASLPAVANDNQTSAVTVSANSFELGIECTGTYYNWGQARNGYGYCYEWTCRGDVLNQGQPVSNYSCESVRPSYYDWGTAQNGWGYCYQYTPYGVAMNVGQPVNNYSCESSRPSYYAWGRSQDGNTRCFQYTAKGVTMNQGQPVSNYYCQ